MPSLPSVPTGKELEDYVAALFQSTQHYVEKNVSEPGVFELDVVATSFASGQPVTQLIEVKGGQWGFSELFKVLGWMHYLSISKGLFVTTRAPEKPLEFYSQRVEPRGLRVMVLPDAESGHQTFEAAGYGTVDARALALWRYSFWAERRTVELLRAEAQAHPERQGPREALRYCRLINEEVFLTADPRERAQKLYSAYMEHPRLTLGIARELDGQPFDTSTPGESAALRASLYEGRHPILQASMYVEHRARLAVLKSVIDCLTTGAPMPSGLQASSLPGSFVNAVRELHDKPQYERYALFWQLLLWGWGGFILDDHREDELQTLAAQSGLDPTNVDSALGAFDLLFPTGASWLRRMSTANYEFVGMVPWPFMGIGAAYRRWIHGVDTFQELGLTGQYTVSDLARRLNALVQHIEPSAD